MICRCRVCERTIWSAGGPGQDRWETCDECSQLINPNKSQGSRKPAPKAKQNRYLEIGYGEENVRVQVDQEDDQELFRAIAADLGFERVVLRDMRPAEAPRSQDETMKAHIIATQIYEMFKKIKGTDQSL